MLHISEADLFLFEPIKELEDIPKKYLIGKKI
jgi:hypothetical protein